MKSVPVPKYPLLILIPQRHIATHERSPSVTSALSKSTLDLLRSACDTHLRSNESYSVTFSPLLCPARKNLLFALKPYWWEVRPGEWGASFLHIGSSAGLKA
jgi:hypothetical protein